MRQARHADRRWIQSSYKVTGAFLTNWLCAKEQWSHFKLLEGCLGVLRVCSTVFSKSMFLKNDENQSDSAAMLKDL